MPVIKDESGGGGAPLGPHLAVLTDESGAALAIPRGARMFIVTNPERKDGVLPVVLVKVSPKELVFKCACRQPKCNAVYTFKASRSGYHPSLNR